MGKKCFVVTGEDQSRFSFLFSGMQKAGITWETFAQKGEPSIDQVTGAAEKARQANVDVVLAIGGGSVLDAAKAVAALVTNRDDIMEYLEVIGRGNPLVQRPAPLIAVPTTSGTGAEVTCNAVLASPEHGVKVSMRSEMMYPDVALVDPCLARFMPGDVTAFTGMDSLTQLIEAFVSRFSNPYTDALCREGMARSARSLRRALSNGQDLDAREDLSMAALFSGIALANAKLGAVHGIAGPMGGMISAPHGLICAVLLAPVMAENVRQLEQSGIPDSSTLAKFGEVAAILTGNSQAGVEQGCGWIRELVVEMDLPSLSRFGLDRAVCRAVSHKALQASSMKGNPVDLDEKAMAALLEAVS